MDMTIYLTSEAIVVIEDFDVYSWILKSQVEMQPRWSIHDIKIIFRDGLLKQSLLDKLFFSHSCVMRVDYYHVMQEIRPKTFGLTFMKK